MMYSVILIKMEIMHYFWTVYCTTVYKICYKNVTTK